MSDRHRNILAIDDTLENLLTLRAALGAEFRLQFATSGAMGLALAEAAPPDLILLDVMMHDSEVDTQRVRLQQLVAELERRYRVHGSENAQWR